MVGAVFTDEYNRQGTNESSKEKVKEGIIGLIEIGLSETIHNLDTIIFHQFCWISSRNSN